jgi:Tfp pilus assembly protein PilN
MKVRLNLATKPLESHRQFLAGVGVVGGIGLVAFIALSITSYRAWRASSNLRRETASLESQVKGLESQQNSYRAFFSQPANKASMERAAFLNSLILQRSFPWIELFEALEKDLPTGVRVVSIAPRMEDGRVQIKLVIGAQSDEGKIQFLKTLETSKSFSQIEVRQETHPKQSQGETDKVLLELQAWYGSA